ncbi:MAG: GTP-binding protein [candidate division SR1 bacterium]|nr:GTP-binding protein [candidate division SR1 bacterium]
MQIRNFCIIAHIDHGKSTLADRMLEITGTVRKIDHAQMLDRMDIEQERGITIKLTPARMQRKGYEFNLIDTPGHVDFQYEVSRSLAAVEGVILLVDASQGIQAQTLSTLYQAIDQNLTIIPVLNKIDLPAANPERVAHEIENVIGIDKSEIIQVSGKTGENVDKVLDAIIERIQDPLAFKKSHKKKFRPIGQDQGQNETQISGISRALIFDSVYDPYKGVLAYVKVVDGEIKSGQNLHLIHTDNNVLPTEVGYFTPDYKADKVLKEGQIGYIVTGEKSVRDVSIGDTMIKDERAKGHDDTLMKNLVIPGFKKVKPFVYAGVYPIDNTDYDKLKDSLEKLSINDSAIEYELEDSKALGFGFRCGFLGMLHMDIVKERLSREYGMETIFTIPTVVYLIKSKYLSLEQIKSGSNIQSLLKTSMYKHILGSNTTDEDAEKRKAELIPWLVIKSGSEMIDQGWIDEIREPVSAVEVVGPQEYAGNIMSLCQEYRGKLINMDYIDETRVVRHYELPMGEIIIDFYDRLKSATKGYATMNYEFKKYQAADLVKLDVYINNEKVEALSRVVHKDKAYYLGKDVVEKLKVLIPKHMFAIPIQVGIGNKMIARENISAMKKDVLAKCYGGDVSRKRKLLSKQKEGKKRMKAIGNVNVPSDVFIKMVARGD